MPQFCLTPGCRNMAAPYDVLCPECRRQSDNCRVAVDVIDLDGAYEGYHGGCIETPALDADLAAIVSFQAREKQQREQVIHLQQRKLDLRGKIIRKLTRQRDRARTDAEAERARADGLAEQNAGLQAALAALVEQMAQLKHLENPNGKREKGFAAVETVPGDWRPYDHAGYNVLYERIDPVTNRALGWYWYRVNGNGG